MVRDGDLMAGFCFKTGQALFEGPRSVSRNQSCVVVDPSPQRRNVQCQGKGEDCRCEQEGKPGKEHPCFAQLHLLLRTLPGEA